MLHKADLEGLFWPKRFHDAASGSEARRSHSESWSYETKELLIGNFHTTHQQEGETLSDHTAIDRADLLHGATIKGGRFVW